MFAQDEIAKNKRPQLKVPHSVRFDPDQIKTTLGLIDKAWSTFSDKVRRLAERSIEESVASSFFEKLLLQKDDKSLSARARREHASIMSLYGSAPGQDLDTAKGTFWGAVNAVSYYVDHVRSVRVGDRLDNAWFGAGGALKDRAWAAACELL